MSNKTQKVILNDDNIDQDKYIFVKLEQDIKTLEILSLQIDQKDIYQSMNSDFGVLVGRVVSDNGIGIPNAKLSVFIPLTDEDSLNSDITSIYPYTLPTDKNNNKRYNLLPRTASYNFETGVYKPKQPFGSFPIKEELMVNKTLLEVYKNYFKFTCLTNNYGDYMMFGIPINTQTIHLSVDITDIGKYSMNPQSMITALGYSPNLFINNATKIKESNDLNSLPNIEVQELAINIIPFWGDVNNFQIGITRQDFKIKSKINGFFTIAGTAISMGRLTTIGNPDRTRFGSSIISLDDGFYLYGQDQDNATDIRTYRTGFTPKISVFSYQTNVPIDILSGDTLGIDFTKDVFQIPSEEYFEFNDNGDFLLNITCNRRKVVFDNSGNEIVVDDNSPFGIFTRFYGMLVFESPELPMDVGFNKVFSYVNIPEINNKSFIKIPQNRGLFEESHLHDIDNYLWRKEHKEFKAGFIYMPAQFWPTKYITPSQLGNIYNIPYSSNILSGNTNYIGGMYAKVAGSNKITQTDIDTLNYIINPNTTGSTFQYDMAYNAVDSLGNKFFGGQWINGLITMINYITAGHNVDPSRSQITSDIVFESFQSTQNYNMSDNTQPIFAGLTNTKNWITSKAMQTDFVELTSSEISKLNLIPKKGINAIIDGNSYGVNIDTSLYKYRKPNIVLDPRGYDQSAWDVWYGHPYTGNTGSAYIFKGSFNNNFIKLILNLI